MEELNRKLAKWRWPDAGEIWVDNLKIVLLTAEGVKVCEPFTSSLDACFKELVPKLGNKYAYSFWQFDDGRWLCQIEKDKEGLVVSTRAETPALALCKALDKLIDNDK